MLIEDLITNDLNKVICDVEINFGDTINNFVAIKCPLYGISFPKNKSILAAYVIIDSVDGLIYAGSTKDIRKRLNLHRSALNTNTHENVNLRKLFEKRQRSDFLLILIECTDRERAFDVEQYLIDHAIKNDLCLNRSIDSRSNYKFKHTEEHRKKTSDKMLGRIVSDVTRVKLSNSLKGRIFNKVTRDKMSVRAIKSLERGGKLERLRQYAKSVRKRVSIEGEVYASIAEASAILNVKKSTVAYRLNSTFNRFSNWKYLE